MSTETKVPPGYTPDTKLPGVPVDAVRLEIDYKIIEHFSKHLYGSPNKAVEELVSNGFDAFAQSVYVYVPGRFVSDFVLVWDDGGAMDIAGLKDLWLIADSPKDKVGRIARGPGNATREMIGKFGIGKLASYSVGSTIAHLCHVSGKYFLVLVNLARVTEPAKPGREPVEEPILELSRDEAYEFARAHFDRQPPTFDEMFAKESWTLAIIGNLKTLERPTDLSAGWLSWILGNGMPLRPDFGVWVNGDVVTPKLARKGAVREWDFGSDELKRALNGKWDEAVSEGEAAGTISFGTASGLDPRRPGVAVPYVEMPKLGRVYGDIRLYADSLESTRAQDQGRSSGFFVLVRGRLINPNDDKLFLHEPSFRTFYRSQFILNVDGLDEDLLADRERVREGSLRAAEMSVLQRALYLLVRTAQQQRDQQEAGADDSSGRLPVHSLPHFREPMTALVLNKSIAGKVDFDVTNPPVLRRALGQTESVAILGDDGFVVNVQHPYYQSLESSFGTGKRAQEFLRRFDIIAVSERLLEGHLIEAGLAPERIREILEWRDGLLRAMAASSPKSIEQLATELEDASYQGEAKFEKAIRAVLAAIGFVADVDGRSGKKDGTLVAPCGSASYRFIFEAKGSRKAIGNSDADISGAAAHREKEEAEHAVVVAREFVGFKAGENPMVLQECNATKGVSIMTTEALIALARAMKRFAYPLDLVKDIFTVVEPPAAKLDRIATKLERPTENFDWRRFLNEVWAQAGSDGYGEWVYYGPIRQRVPEWKKMPLVDFSARVVALTYFAPMLITVDPAREVITLRQTPENIVAEIERAVNPRDPE